MRATLKLLHAEVRDPKYVSHPAPAGDVGAARPAQPQAAAKSGGPRRRPAFSRLGKSIGYVAPSRLRSVRRGLPEDFRTLGIIGGYRATPPRPGRRVAVARPAA